MSSQRISARRGRPVELECCFFRNGVPDEPFAIHRVEIYKNSVAPHNLVETIVFSEFCDPLYPSPARRKTTDFVGECGTEEEDQIVPGCLILDYTIPETVEVPDIFFDVWYFFADDPRDDPSACAEADLNCTDEPTACDLDQYLDQLISCCHRFWGFPDQSCCGDDLETVNFGFEPLNQKFFVPERKPLEVGLMPLPLYQFNFSLVMPIIPQLTGTITIKTQSEEVLVDEAAMCIGLRQGNFRTNPYVMRYDIDTTKFLKGTYKYRVSLQMPNGSIRTSPDFILVIA